MKKFFLAVLVLAGVVALGLSVSAQDAAPEQLKPVFCRELFPSGTVEVNLAFDADQVFAGSQARFNVNISNTGSAPIVDGAVYGKIYKAEPNKAGKGILVDQFFIQEKLTLDSKTSKNLDYIWKSPAFAPGGEYTLYSYMVTGAGANLRSPSFFPDEREAGKVAFMVKEQVLKSVQVVPSQTKIGGKILSAGNPVPSFPSSTKVKVEVPLSNPTTKKQDVEVTYSLYQTDNAVNPKEIITSTEKVSLAAGASKTLVYEVADTSYPIYELIVKARWNDFSSAAEARITREGIYAPMINLAGINSFPVKAEKEAAFLVCFNNGALEGATKARLEIAIAEAKSGKEIQKYTYEGYTTAIIEGIKASFAPGEGYDQIKVMASIFDEGGKLLDSIEMTYDCKTINPQNCETAQKPPVGPEEKMNLKPYLLAVAGLVVVAGLFFLIRLLKRRHDGDDQTPGGQQESNAPVTPSATDGSTSFEVGEINRSMVWLVIGGVMASLFFSLNLASAAGPLEVLPPTILFVGDTPSEPNFSEPNIILSFGVRPNYGVGTVEIGDKIIYEFDWDGNGTVDDRSPYLSYESPGSAVHTWTTTGKKIIKVRVRYYDVKDDDTYKYSEWGQFQLNIVRVVPITTITGPATGKKGVSYDFTGSSVLQVEGDEGGNLVLGDNYWLRHGFGWLDLGSRTFWDTGESITRSRSFSNTGVYTLRVKGRYDPLYPGDMVDDIVEHKITITEDEPVIPPDDEEKPECDDSIDNDGDGRVDFDGGGLPAGPDLGCRDANDNDETSIPDLIIGGPTAGNPGIQYTFSARSEAYLFAADGVPVTQKVKYGFDWNNDAIVDFWTSWVQQGQSNSASFTWASLGSKTFGVKAQDYDRAESYWGYHAINISNNGSAVCTEGDIWSSCSTTCGGGTKNLYHTDDKCVTTITQSEICNPQACDTTIIEVPPGVP